MIVSFYFELSEYVRKKMQENPGSFLRGFLECCVLADSENFELLKPVLEKIVEKYPLRSYK